MLKKTMATVLALGYVLSPMPILAETHSEQPTVTQEKEVKQTEPPSLNQGKEAEQKEQAPLNQGKEAEQKEQAPLNQERETEQKDETNAKEETVTKTIQQDQNKAQEVQAASASQGSFIDVPNTYFAYEAITYLANKNIVSGYGDGKFGPEDNVTREQVARLLYVALGLQSKAEYKNPYHDVSNSTTMFSNEILALTEAGIFKGDQDGNFRPKSPLTRAEMAQVLKNAFNLKVQAAHTFNDITANYAWANDAISALQSNGITVGTGNGKFEPGTTTTRGQYSKFLYETMKLKQATKPELPTDGDKKVGWVQDQNNWYYFDQNGVMKTGWVQVDNARYYMAENGAMKTGWVQVDNAWYYMAENGAMKTGWVQVDNTWYYMAKNGTMKTGWVQVDNTWYYMAENGAMKTSWVQVDNTWYYMAENGAMKTSWVQVDNAWYYMAENGAMKTGWVQVDNAWYYMAENGAMKTGWIEINGISYYLDTNGAWIEQPIYFGKTIVVDAGHGGKDSGAVYKSILEKDIALSVSLKLQKLLENSGMHVVMTRATDTFIELSDRVKISNKNKADIFVSVHVNSADSPAAAGIETLYNPDHPKSNQVYKLASAVQKSLIANTGGKSRGLKERPELRVLKGDNQALPILVETGFITNTEDRLSITSNNYQNKLSQSIFEGIQNYLSR
ncbi:N-acetylmuramoyl-L-alanine amidase [Bacillus sp. S13(2024)]|uniref:N-acetylmuramoyl-L-alanine amidase n=1 Tax=unclassified Bacillus (in: firmicutes) TaxID=185979 RepID=UPI003D194B93